MFPTLKKLLERRGVSKLEELSDEERATFDQIKRELEQAKPLQPVDWENFLEAQLNKLTLEFDPDASEKKQQFIWTQLSLYMIFLSYLKRPKKDEELIKKKYKVE